MADPQIKGRRLGLTVTHHCAACVPLLMLAAFAPPPSGHASVARRPQRAGHARPRRAMELRQVPPIAPAGAAITLLGRICRACPSRLFVIGLPHVSAYPSSTRPWRPTLNSNFSPLALVANSSHTFQVLISAAAPSARAHRVSRS